MQRWASRERRRCSFGLDSVAEGRGQATEGAPELPVEQWAVRPVELGVRSQLQVQGVRGVRDHPSSMAASAKSAATLGQMESWGYSTKELAASISKTARRGCDRPRRGGR